MKPIKEAEKLREEARAEANAMPNKLRKKLRVLLPVLGQSVCNDGAGIAGKIPLINKMMINWAEKQAPEPSSN